MRKRAAIDGKKGANDSNFSYSQWSRGGGRREEINKKFNFLVRMMLVLIIKIYHPNPKSHYDFHAQKFNANSWDFLVKFAILVWLTLLWSWFSWSIDGDFDCFGVSCDLAWIWTYRDSDRKWLATSTASDESQIIKFGYLILHHSCTVS